jgi:hypothetical protein
LQAAEAGQRHGLVLLGFQDHAVLVGLGENGRDDALAEGAVERVVDARRGDAQARGRVAVDVDDGCRAHCAGVGGDVAQLLLLGHAGDELARPLDDGGIVGAFERDAVLGRAAFGVDGQVLGRLQVQGQAGHVAPRGSSGAS